MIWRAYQRLLERHPWKTQCLMTGFLMASGDAIAQFAIERKQIRQFDPKRTVRFFSFGVIIAGPAIRTWYGILDKYLKGTTGIRALKMVAADQFIFAPIFIANFLIIMGAMRGDSFEQTKTKLKSDYPSILINNYKVWPAVQIVNFYFIPLQHRLLLVNTVALFWNSYLTWMAERRPVITEIDDKIEMETTSSSAN